MALWSGIMVAFHLQLSSIHIYSDSKFIIDGINGKCRMQGQHLSEWIERVLHILSKFQSFSLQQIFREKNMRADLLSKKGLEVPYGAIHISHYRASILEASFHIPLP